MSFAICWISAASTDVETWTADSGGMMGRNSPLFLNAEFIILVLEVVGGTTISSAQLGRGNDGARGVVAPAVDRERALDVVLPRKKRCALPGLLRSTLTAGVVTLSANFSSPRTRCIASWKVLAPVTGHLPSS